MEKDQEIKNLAKEIEAKEQVLKQEGEPIEEKEIVKEVLKEKIENYLETKPETPSAIKPEQPSYSKKEPLPTAPLIDEKLAETGEIKELIDIVVQYKGLFVFLWHNDQFNRYEALKRAPLYKKIVEYFYSNKTT